MAKMKADTFIQHHRAVQSLTTIPTLAKLPFGHQTAFTYLHCAWEKQPAKADHSSVACFEYGIYLYIHVPFCLWWKIESPDMGNKTDFLRPDHI